MIISSLRGKQVFGAAYFFAFFFNLFSIYWIAMVTPPGMVMAVTIVALYYAAILATFNKLCQIKPLYGVIALPFLWVGMEHFRTLTEFAFPWSDLGYTQAYFGYILQIVSVISVHGLSLLILTVNVLLWQVLRKTLSSEQRLTSFFAACTIVGALVAYGWIVTPRFQIEGDYKIALLQGSVSLEEKWRPGNRDFSFSRYDSLAQSVTDDDVRLFVWPETSAPCFLSHQRGCREAVGAIARRTNSYHLVGALGAAFEENMTERHFNSCYQFGPDGELDRRYDKQKLVPFSEHVPYQDYLPFLTSEFLSKYLTFIETYDVQWWSDFYPGRDSSLLFELPDAGYAALICFESAFPEFSRQAILDGAEFLVGITNDTWFGQSVGIHMHSNIFITRAVENRCWWVRAANTGLTYFVDGYGRIRGELEPYEVGALSGKITRLSGLSIFTRYGDVAGRFSFLLTISIIGILTTIWIIRKIFPGRL